MLGVEGVGFFGGRVNVFEGEGRSMFGDMELEVELLGIVS